MKIFIGQKNPVIGDISQNVAAIVAAIQQAKNEGCDLVVFPEMAICGYCPDDLLFASGFVAACERGLGHIIECAKDIAVIVGTVRPTQTTPAKPFRNSAAVIIDGKLAGFQDKCLLPTYDVFDEWRYFEPAKTERVWQIGDKKVAITICEDIWPAFDPFCQARYQDDPLAGLDEKDLDLLVNISASPYSLGKIERRKLMVKQVAKRLQCPVLLVNQVGADDGLLFDGSSCLVSAKGELLFQAKSFAEDLSVVASNNEPQCIPGEELYKALVMGVKDYFAKQGFQKAMVGLSGGVDSAVVACIAKEALGSENVLGVLLPSRYTSEISSEDAQYLAQNLGIKTEVLSIESAFKAVVETLEPAFKGRSQDVTEENIQSRLRAILLMGLSNKLGYLVLNTGNKSELAMGYTTLYGDAIGSICVLGDLLKTQVYEVSRYINQAFGSIPERVITREPTAELRFGQKDSDSLPEYALLDPIVDDFVVHNFSATEIAEKRGVPLMLVQAVILKIYQNEYKRRQVPFALRVSEKAFSVGRRVPIVHKTSLGT